MLSVEKVDPVILTVVCGLLMYSEIVATLQYPLYKYLNSRALKKIVLQTIRIQIHIIIILSP